MATWSKDTGGPSWTSLPGYFLNHGFSTLGSGKLFHPNLPPNNDYELSWSKEWPYFGVEVGAAPKSAHNWATQGNGSTQVPRAMPCKDRTAATAPPNCFECLETLPGQYGFPYCAANVSKDEARLEFQLEDQRITASCVSQLASAAAVPGRPFFVGCGVHKPHVPWIMPFEFRAQFGAVGDIPLPQWGYEPSSMPAVAWHGAADELSDGGQRDSTNTGYGPGFDADPVLSNLTNWTRSGGRDANVTRTYRLAYYAAVAYQDYNIGKILAQLEALGHTANTVTLLLGDHGFHLGEQNTWAKYTNFEIGVRIPLIIRAPWLASSVGKVTDILAEATDVYPTLAELAGLPSPLSTGEQINGTSLVPALRNPADTSAKMAAFSQYAKVSLERQTLFWPCPWSGDQNMSAMCTEPFPACVTGVQIMSYSVRVADWRYTAHFAMDDATVTVKTDSVIARELYSFAGFDGSFDWPGMNTNVAGDPTHAALVEELHSKVLGYIRLS